MVLVQAVFINKKGSLITQPPFLIVVWSGLKLNPLFNFFHISAELLVCFNQVVYGTAACNTVA